MKSKQYRIYRLFLFSFTAAVSVPALADPFCFSRAQSYYEQVYCELQAKAQLQGLPGFEEFRNNSEPVQYSLLKRPAERNRIKLPPAKASVQTQSLQDNNQQESLPAKVKLVKKSVSQILPSQTQLATDNNECQLTGEKIRCGGISYKAQGNLRNSRLGAGVLEPDNKMAIPERTGNQSESDYLLAAYVQYLNKMREIGLGGVTTSYGKFAFLYRDLRARGLNFSQRFETMFGYLKKDKATLGVNEGVSLPTELSPQDCAQLNEELLVCSVQGRNYLFVAE